MSDEFRVVLCNIPTEEAFSITYTPLKLPDYKDQSAQSKIVISAGIAEIQAPWMASAEHILVVWIPAIPRYSLTRAGSAGKTLLLKHVSFPSSSLGMPTFKLCLVF
ncbi:hypothetical protein [Methylicorpusculum sp.]|uniref:hypothetical protein n=1 Tax=Methylicorpusculum sp. TaxID=2713644 RepID=UPI002731ACE4|nr:hypothetical protein [Methylicorpusculum sp.]MDP2178620.1 hypothetical protein [Methylicorpusculum sp.]MDP3527769.1 hypothetical protein [Methylicorpusculum sp.]